MLAMAVLGAAAAAGAVELHPYGQRGWVHTEGSVVLYDSSGTVTSELPIGSWEERLPGGRLRRTESLAGAAGEGRFAWSLEKVRRVRPLRQGEAVLESVRLLRYLGTHGQELWRSDSADAPRGLEPVYLGEDGETILLFERQGGGKGVRWTAALYHFTGNRLVEASQGVPAAVSLSPNGRYAAVRWEGPRPMSSFLSAGGRSCLDIPSAELPAGALRVDGKGRVFAGKKFLFELR